MRTRVMNEIDVLFHCGNRFCEIPSDDVSAAEAAVEEMTSLALITIFDSIKVHGVSVTFLPAGACAEATIEIAIRARGIDPLPMVDCTSLDCVVEDRLSCALVEFFGMLNVERCAVG